MARSIQVDRRISSKKAGNSVYSKQVLFKDLKTGEMFRVYQRGDIDPNYVITYGPNKGKTNL